MSTVLTPITNANTFGQWKEKTNDIITALGNTVTLGDAETNNGNIVLTGTGNVTSQGTLYINTIDATAANSANIITINADAKLNGELQINNTYESEVNYYQSSILTWTTGTNSTHSQFDIKKGSVVLRVDETAGAITGTGLTIDDSLLPDLITSNIDGNVTGQLLATDTERSHGAYGSHDTAKIGHVWSMGTDYSIPNTGADFGSLSGMAYKHSTNTSGGTMAGGHQIVFTEDGVSGASIGLGGNIWAKGNIYENNTLLSTTYLNRVLGGTITGAISTNKAITLTGTGANGTVTAAKFSGPLTGAVTGNVTGNVTGDVTGNADTATKLATGRTIDITGDITATAVLFDGSSNIAISASVDNNSHTHTSSNISDAASINTASTLVKRDASGNFTAGTITATEFSGDVDGDVTGNADTATKLANARTITLAGDTSGSVSFDGSGNVTLTVTVSDDSHAHTYANLTSIPSSFTPSSHTHGNLTNDGKIGTTADKVIVTSTGGAIAAKTSGTSGQFLNGLGAWATPTNTVYTHPSVNHIPSGGAEGQALVYSSAGNATWSNAVGLSNNNVLLGKDLTIPLSASSNTIIGYGPMVLTTGNFNVAVGAYAGADLSTGEQNTMVGYGAGDNITSGIRNVMIGMQSGLGAKTANDNICIGYRAGQYNDEGNGNVCIGGYSWTASSSYQYGGDYNTFIGHKTGFDSNQDDSGNIYIGHATSNGSHSPCSSTYGYYRNDNIIMGHTAIARAYIKVGWSITSDARDKTEIEEVPHGLDFVKQLSPVSFKYKESREDATPAGDAHYGFLAQDVLALEGDNSVIVDDHDPERLHYNDHHMTAVLVKAIKELSLKVEELEAKCAGL